MRAGLWLDMGVLVRFGSVFRKRSHLHLDPVYFRGCMHFTFPCLTHITISFSDRSIEHKLVISVSFYQSYEYRSGWILDPDQVFNIRSDPDPDCCVKMQTFWLFLHFSVCKFVSCQILRIFFCLSVLSITSVPIYIVQKDNFKYLRHLRGWIWGSSCSENRHKFSAGIYHSTYIRVNSVIWCDRGIRFDRHELQFWNLILKKFFFIPMCACVLSYHLI